MAAETHTYTPKKRFAGSFPEAITAPVTVLLGENVADLEVVASNAAGKIVAHAGFSTAVDTEDNTDKVAGLMNGAVDATAADAAGNIYEGGVFFADQIVWPANANTNALKRKLLEGSMLKVVFQDVGEV